MYTKLLVVYLQSRQSPINFFEVLLKLIDILLKFFHLALVHCKYFLKPLFVVFISSSEIPLPLFQVHHPPVFDAPLFRHPLRYHIHLQPPLQYQPTLHCFLHYEPISTHKFPSPGFRGVHHHLVFLLSPQGHFIVVSHSSFEFDPFCIGESPQHVWIGGDPRGLSRGEWANLDLLLVVLD
jgi:hypothetical protein